MKVVILGADGLIGHKLLQTISDKYPETLGTIRSDAPDRIIKPYKLAKNIDATRFSDVCKTIDDFKADVVFNCIGITKRKIEIRDMELAVYVNALFPHKLANWAHAKKIRVIHFSTDCVFDGTLGNYTEESNTTAVDTYGKTKALGEITNGTALTIRSSFIGHEIKGKTELLEWCKASRGCSVNGYTSAYYSGISTIEMSRIMLNIIENHHDLKGLYQLSSSENISKYDLVCMINKHLDLQLTVSKDQSVKTMPTLMGTKLSSQISLEIPTWDNMLSEIALEADSYISDGR